MSVICQNFVQNAWRKDLCSNCFKSEADHSQCGYKSSGDVLGRRYIPQATSLYQSRGLSMNINWRPLHPVQRIQDRIACRDFGSQTSVAEKSSGENRRNSAKGILKDCEPKRSKNRRTSVGFTSEEPLVIGYGGRDYDSDDSPWELGSDDESINLELLDLTDEDRCITKLTKNNTEFNSVNDNLIGSPTLRESHTTSDKNFENERRNLRFENDQMKNFKTASTTILSTNKQETKPENYYYFSTKTDPVKPCLPKFNDQTNYLNECKEMSLITKDIPGIISNIENNNTDICRKVDNLNKMNLINDHDRKTDANQDQECQNTNSSRYLLITKVHDSCGSDSDYSTSKQTNGESSTDSESFHDAEEAIMIPCSSFLHGTSSIESQNNMRNYVPKPFETSSLSSADTSTFSDDSDSQKPQEMVPNKTRNNHSKSSSPPFTGSKSVSAKSTVVQNKVRVNLIQSTEEPKRKQGSNCTPTDSRTNSSNYESTNCKSNVSNNLRLKTRKEESKAEEAKIVNQVRVSAAKTPTTTTSSRNNTNNISVKQSAVPEKKESNRKKETCTPTEAKSYHHRHTIPTDSNGDKKCRNNTRSGSMVITPTSKDSGSTEIKCESTKAAAQTNVQENNKTNQVINSSTENTDAYRKDRESAEMSSKTRPDLEKQDSYGSEDDSWRSEGRKSHSFSSPAFTTDTEDHEGHQDNYNSGSSSSSTRSSPNSKVNRESKLAALALELEKVRCDGSSTKECRLQDVACSTPRIKVPPKCEYDKSNTTFETPTSGKYPSIRRGRSLVTPNQAPKSSLPDLLSEPTTKLKKNRFSLKKLLKRGKDSDTLVINNPNDYNPKAWKRQTFDRSRLSLEIVHPMDMTTDPPTSTDSTPTEEKRNTNVIFSDPSARHHGKFSSGTPRARSLSALPHLGSCVSGISDLGSGGLRKNDISSLDRPQLDIPRKAGTVAERGKKYRAPRRTPSFSELRTSTTTSGRSTDSGVPSERPPKPPPPPRGKSLPPPQLPVAPPPPPQEKSRNQMPVRPPPPKLQEATESNLSGQGNNSPKNDREHVIGDYANLGDIRLNITPKKPQRPSAISFARDALETDEDHSQHESPLSQQVSPIDNTYECLEAQEEEDHYTYLDETEVKSGTSHKAHNGSGNSFTKTQNTSKTLGEKQPSGSNASPVSRTSLILKKPWMNLHASYAAIAAANYESLAELITTAISEGLEQFQKTASALRWSDFDLESNDPMQTLDDKIVYNAIYKNQPKTKVTLMVTTQKQHTTQNNRSTNRPPVLAAFNDMLPEQLLNIIEKRNSYSDTQKAMIYVLQRSKPTTVNQFAHDSASFQANQHVHLRNACFVLLQLIHTLKSLQAEGIEEIDYDMGRILLLHTDVDKPPILVLLPGDKVYLTMTDYYKADVATRKTTLCQTTLQLLFHLLQIDDVKELNSCVVNGECLASPIAHTFGVIAKILQDEKASSLTQAKGLLEYMLWGPVDIKTTGTEEGMDVILQRWLDLQRAQMVKSLVSNLHLKISSHTGFHVYEEYQLIFLLQATVKSLKDIISKL